MGEQGYDRAAFDALQQQMASFWPQMTMRQVSGGPLTVFVLSSVSLEVPAHMAPLLPAYEERYLCYVLLLAKSPHTRVVYLTSQPVLPRLVDYYLALVPGLSPGDLRDRLTVVSVGDSSIRPLTEKILERPRLVRRLREQAPPGRSLMLPYVTTELEARLAVELGVPVYGPPPALGHLGTKSGSREVFRAAGVDLPYGVERVRSPEEILAAAIEIRHRTGARDVMVKMDSAVSGFGNAVLALGETADADVDLDSLVPEDPHLTVSDFLAELSREGGIVEERLTAEELTSPSVQLRASPLGEVEVISTHDQVLGGVHGQTYLGCRFPASEDYARQLTEPALAIGKELASRGVIGKFGVDFVASRGGPGPWRLSAVEINLRNGGTTHPLLTLQALTDAGYDCEQAALVSRGRAKRYVATDHLEHPGLSVLTPDDLLDVVEEAGLGWDEETHTGVAFHMVSAIAAAGCVGLTAIGDSHRQAQWLYDAARTALVAEVAGSAAR